MGKVFRSKYLWQYGLSSFQERDTKLKIFLAKDFDTWAILYVYSLNTIISIDIDFWPKFKPWTDPKIRLF